MDHKNIIWIKQENTDEAHTEPDSMVQVYPSSVKVELPDEDVNQEVQAYPSSVKVEQPDEHVNQEFLEEPLGECASSYTSEHSKLNLCCNESETNLLFTYSTDFIKEEDPEINLEKNETENTVISSTRHASDNIRLIRDTGTSCEISFEEVGQQAVVPDDLEIIVKTSMRFAMCDTGELTTQEDSSVSATAKLKCCLRDRKYHIFRCSVCLQSFTSKYRLIMHVFIHIDGVQAPVHVCKLCGEVFPSNVTLNKHLRMIEGDHSLSAGNYEKFDYSDHSEYIIFLKGDREFSIVETTEKLLTSKESGKNFRKYFSGIYNPHYTEKPARCDDYGTLSTAGSVKVHTVLFTVERRHRCNFCGKSFNRLCHLKAHSLIHNGVKAHKCDICDQVNRMAKTPA